MFSRLDPKTQWDIWTTPEVSEPGGVAQRPTLYLQTEFNEHDGVLSPDGRWMAYSSDQSGRWEVYVGEFPPRGARGTPVSNNGGNWPQWRRDGRELFYRAADQRLMAVTVRTDAGFSASAPRALFTLRTRKGGARTERVYAASTDGQRFLVNVTREDAPSPVSVFLNWPATLPKR